MKALLRLFVLDLKNKRYNEQFYAGISFLFAYDASIHKFHFQIPDEELKKLRTAT